MQNSYSDTIVPPRLSSLDLPIDERDAAWLIELNLIRFKSHVDDFAAALSLFDLCLAVSSQAQANSNWIFVPARDGAMSVYHAYTVLDGIRKTLSSTPRLDSLVDKDALKEAGKIFHTKFPDFEKLRDAIAHIAEQTTTPRMRDKHAYSGPLSAGEVTSSTVSNWLEHRQFSNTWSGKLVKYEISEASLAHLRNAQHCLWCAFRG